MEEGMTWWSKESSNAEKISLTLDPYNSPLGEGMKHWSSTGSILNGPETTYPRKPYQADHFASPLEAGMGEWSRRASEFSDTDCISNSNTGHGRVSSWGNVNEGYILIDLQAQGRYY